MKPDRTNHVPEIKRALSDPTKVLEALGILGEGRARQRQAGGWIILCPVHNEKSPSCSVQNRGGELLWHCHGCDTGGDVLSLVAAVRGLNTKRNFRDVLLEAARIGGLWHAVDDITGRVTAREERRAAAPAPVVHAPVERPWPPLDEVLALWDACGPVSDDDETAAYLRGRGVDPEGVDGREIGRVLGAGVRMPRWASYRGAAAEARPWAELGYRLLVPVFDHGGAMRSVRAWRVRDGEGPKRLPPSGFKAKELVMADTFGLAMLRGERQPEVVAIVEGEPDFYARCQVTRDPRVAIVGIVSGSWTARFAERVPVGCRVSIRTDNDAAGDRYAAEIVSTLRHRAFPFRLKGAA